MHCSFCIQDQVQVQLYFSEFTHLLNHFFKIVFIFKKATNCWVFSSVFLINYDLKDSSNQKKLLLKIAKLVIDN